MTIMLHNSRAAATNASNTRDKEATHCIKMWLTNGALLMLLNGILCHFSTAPITKPAIIPNCSSFSV